MQNFAWPDNWWASCWRYFKIQVTTSIFLLFLQEVKISSPDYLGVDPEEAIADFQKRIESLESEYETIDENIDNDLSFIKIYNQGNKFLVNKVQGKVQSRI